MHIVVVLYGTGEDLEAIVVALRELLPTTVTFILLPEEVGDERLE